MQERQERTAERFRFGVSFFERHPIPNAPRLLDGMRNQLQQSLARIEDAARVHRNFPVDGHARVEHRRDALRKRKLIPLRRLALPLFTKVPGARTALQVPPAHASAAMVAAAAHRMADFLLPKSGFLRSAGITKDFLRELKQEARTLALSTRELEDARRRRALATRTVKSEITRGLGALSTLEGLIALHAPDQLSSWKNITGVSKKLGRPRKVRRRRPSMDAGSDTRLDDA